MYEARYAAQDDEFQDESWELMHQFLGAPLRIRLTTFLRHQFVHLYFPYMVPKILNSTDQLSSTIWFRLNRM